MAAVACAVQNLHLQATAMGIAGDGRCHFTPQNPPQSMSARVTLYYYPYLYSTSCEVSFGANCNVYFDVMRTPSSRMAIAWSYVVASTARWSSGFRSSVGALNLLYRNCSLVGHNEECRVRGISRKPSAAYSFDYNT
jgi:hypothetical protein